MICCDKCGKKLWKYAPSKASFCFTEVDSDCTRRQEHDFSVDLCMDCQVEILKSIGIPVLLTFPENRERIFGTKEQEDER